MQEPRLAYLLDRYISRQCTAHEKAELFQLLESADYDETLKQSLEKMIAQTGAEMQLPKASGNRMLESILSKTQAPEVIVTSATPIKKTGWRRWATIAAASVILIGMVVYFLKITPATRNISDNSANLAISKNWLHDNTSVTESCKIILPDGTQVWLSPSSSLEYPSAFTGTTREIKLSGEAFFEVTSDPQHPFIIHSGTIQTKVLGTSFNIQAYENQEEIAVMVVTGKVNVTHADKTENIDLVANERAVFHRKTTKLIKENAAPADAPDLLKRKEGMFVYKNERLQKLIDDLQEYFGINIHVADVMKDCKVNANFYLTDDMDEILEPLAIMVNGDLAKSGNQFTISGKGCP